MEKLKVVLRKIVSFFWGGGWKGRFYSLVICASVIGIILVLLLTFKFVADTSNRISREMIAKSSVCCRVCGYPLNNDNCMSSKFVVRVNGRDSNKIIYNGVDVYVQVTGLIHWYCHNPERSPVIDVVFFVRSNGQPEIGYYSNVRFEAFELKLSIDIGAIIRRLQPPRDLATNIS